MVVSTKQKSKSKKTGSGSSERVKYLIRGLTKDERASLKRRALDYTDDIDSMSRLVRTLVILFNRGQIEIDEVVDMPPTSDRCLYMLNNIIEKERDRFSKKSASVIDDRDAMNRVMRTLVVNFLDGKIEIDELVPSAPL